MKTVLKETAIFLANVVFLAVLWHNDLLSDPLDRAARLFGGGVSPSHPIVWGGAVYLIVLLFRLPNIIFKLVEKRKH